MRIDGKFARARVRRQSSTLWPLVVLAWSGCYRAPFPDSAYCVAGQTQDCACRDGRRGTAACAGSTWGSCECPFGTGDAGSAQDSGTASRYGTCGSSVFQYCVCGATDWARVGNCVRTDITSGSACRADAYRALSACCPNPTAALNDCETAAVSTADGGRPPCAPGNTTCIQRVCAVEQGALDACLRQGLRTDECERAWRKAIGNAEPATDSACR